VKNMNAKSFLAAALVLAALAVTACGGSSSDEGSESASAGGGDESSRPAAGGMFANLTDEQTQCLEDQGVTLPEMPEGEPPEGMPEGEPPEGMPEGGPPEDLPEGATPPEGMGEGLEDMQAAMSECGIEMPAPPEGAPGQEGAPQADDA
jgi:hypothetical protein